MVLFLPIILKAENIEFIELKTPATRNPSNKDPRITKYKGILSIAYPGNFNATGAVF